MKPKILFVDDDRYFADRYVAHLETLFTVIRIHDAMEVIDYLQRYDDVKLIILDIMMPTPKGVPTSATDDGMDTGLWLLQELLGALSKRPTPVLIFTNRKDSDVMRIRIDEMGLPERLVVIRTKRNRGALDLPKVANEHLERFSSMEVTEQ